jgi:hypothetical protein
MYNQSMSLKDDLSPSPFADARVRLQVDLTPSLVSLLDHIGTVTGASRSGIAIQALTEVLPVLVERVDGLKRRAGEVNKGKR